MHVPVLAAALALALLPSAARAQVEDPRAVVRAAELAVESDSVAAAAARWEARRRRDAGDRAGALGLATLARLTYDYPDAERRYRALAEALADRYAVHARLGLAYGLDARGLTAEMLAQLDSARALARLIGDGEGEGLVLVTRALAHANAFGVDAGLALLDSAERLLPAGTPDLHAERLRRRAIMLAVLQRPEAREVAARALVLARRSGSRLAEARALRAIGTELKLRNRDDSALVALRAAEALYRRTRTHDELALTLMFRVGSELQRGTLGEAKAALREAIASAEVAHDLFSLATARLATAAIATRVHDYTTATEQLERALVAFEQLSDSGSIAMVQHNLATVSLATGDPAGARARVHAALARHRRIGERGGEFEALRLLAMIAARERDWAGAERWLAEARGMLRRGEQLPEWRPALHYTESRLALARGHLDAAARLSRRFLASLDSAQHVARYDARMRLADVHAQRGEMARAEREAVEAADQLDRWRASLSDQQLRLRVFEASPWEDNDRDVSVARVLGALARAGRVEAAFALAERRRARELLDQIARGATRAAPARPVADLAALRAALERIARASGGRLGVGIELLESGESLVVNGAHRHPMQSVYKLPIAMAALHAVDQGALRLDQPVEVRPADFISAAQHSPVRDAHPDGARRCRCARCCASPWRRATERRATCSSVCWAVRRGSPRTCAGWA